MYPGSHNLLIASKRYHIQNNYQLRDNGWAVDAGRFHKLEEVHQTFRLHLLKLGMDAKEGASATHTITAGDNMNSINDIYTS